jgi:hypothetical protein
MSVLLFADDPKSAEEWTSSAFRRPISCLRPSTWIRLRLCMVKKPRDALYWFKAQNLERLFTGS